MNYNTSHKLDYPKDFIASVEIIQATVTNVQTLVNHSNIMCKHSPGS